MSCVQSKLNTHRKNDDIDDRLIGDSGSASDRRKKKARMMEKLQSTNKCFEVGVVVVFAFV